MRGCRYAVEGDGGGGGQSVVKRGRDPGRDNWRVRERKRGVGMGGRIYVERIEEGCPEVGWEDTAGSEVT
jgi:hypothetical protein